MTPVECKRIELVKNEGFEYGIDHWQAFSYYPEFDKEAAVTDSKSHYGRYSLDTSISDLTHDRVGRGARQKIDLPRSSNLNLSFYVYLGSITGSENLHTNIALILYFWGERTRVMVYNIAWDPSETVYYGFPRPDKSSENVTNIQLGGMLGYRWNRVARNLANDFKSAFPTADLTAIQSLTIELVAVRFQKVGFAVDAIWDDISLSYESEGELTPWTTTPTQQGGTVTGIDANFASLVVGLVVIVAAVLLASWKKVGKKHEPAIPPQVKMLEEVAKPAPKPPEPIYREVARRVSTGRKGLDQLLGGGLKSGYAVALTSPTCDELDLFTHEFLEAGLQANSSVLYMTAKLTGEVDLASKYPSRFYCIICNPQAAPKEPRMPSVHIVRSLDSLTEINLTVARILEEMEKAGQHNVACIDIVSDVLLQHGLVATRQWLLDFISRMKSKSVTMLAIVNPQMHPSEDLESVVGLFDGQISIWEQKTAGKSQKLIGVKRMYREQYSAEPLPISKEDLS